MVIENLVCYAGPFEGFAPVINGDNAGPHQDAKLYRYVVNSCKEKYMRETQGHQMPHMNVLDLTVFTETLIRHSHFIMFLKGM